MAWNNQGGGGPWGGGGNSGGPWGGGRGPSNGGGGGPKSGPNPPDLEELLRKGQERMKSFIPGGSTGPRGLILILLIAVGLWALTGFYRVQPGEVGVELLFGKYIRQTQPGLNYWMPTPIGEVLRPNVEVTNQMSVGFRGTGEAGGGAGVGHDVPQESMMLTGDQNIIDVDFIIQWRIKDAASFLFNIRDPFSTIKAASESAMREVIGRTALEEAITRGRQKVQDDTQALLQSILDSYGAGVAVLEVKLQKADPPQQVIDAFNDVQRAKQDQERLQNEAMKYRNDIVPKAKGLASRMVQDAEAFKEKVVKEAEGEAQGFLAVYEQYKTSKDVTTRRIYLEHMQEILSKADKVIIDPGTKGNGVVPYLPLPEIQKKRNASGGTN